MASKPVGEPSGVANMVDRLPVLELERVDELDEEVHRRLGLGGRVVCFGHLDVTVSE